MHALFGLYELISTQWIKYLHEYLKSVFCQVSFCQHIQDYLTLLGSCPVQYFIWGTIPVKQWDHQTWAHCILATTIIQWSKGFMQILFLWMRELTTKSSKSSLDAWVVGEATNLIKMPLYSGECPKGFLFAPQVSAKWVSIYTAKY